MSGHSGSLISLKIYENTVIATFTKQSTSMSQQMIY